MNFNEIIGNEWKIEEKIRGILTKLLVSKLLIALEHQTWYQSNAKPQYSYLMVVYGRKLFEYSWILMKTFEMNEKL